MRQYQTKMMQGTAVIALLLAGLLALSTGQADEADATELACRKVPTSAGIALRLVGFDGMTGEYGIRQNGSVHSTSDSLDDTVVDGDIDDDWTIRARGESFPEPHLLVACTRDGEAPCSVIADGGHTLLDLTGFTEDDEIDIRKNDGWYGVTTGSSTLLKIDGSIDDLWELRVSGARWAEPFDTITCELQPVEPTTAEITDDDPDWADRCLLFGERVDSIIDADQCRVIERSLRAENAMSSSDPCAYPLLCGDEGPTWMWLSIEPTSADLALFPTVTELTVVPLTPPPHELGPIGTMTQLEALSIASDDLDEIPAELARLENLTTLDLIATPGIRSIPEGILALPSLTEIDMSGSGVRGDVAEVHALLGDPSEATLTITWWDGLDECPVWTSHEAWNTWLLATDPSWADCQQR